MSKKCGPHFELALCKTGKYGGFHLSQHRLAFPAWANRQNTVRRPKYSNILYGKLLLCKNIIKTNIYLLHGRMELRASLLSPRFGIFCSFFLHADFISVLYRHELFAVDLQQLLEALSVRAGGNESV